MLTIAQRRYFESRAESGCRFVNQLPSVAPIPFQPFVNAGSVETMVALRKLD